MAAPWASKRLPLQESHQRRKRSGRVGSLADSFAEAVRELLGISLNAPYGNCRLEYVMTWGAQVRLRIPRCQASMVAIVQRQCDRSDDEYSRKRIMGARRHRARLRPAAAAGY